MTLKQPICDRINYYALNNGTTVIKGFEGIPQNFTINIVVFAIIFLLFCFLRKNAWNYGRLALLSKFLKTNNEVRDYNVWTTISENDKTSHVSSVNTQNDGEKTKLLRTQSVNDSSSEFDKGLFNWLKFFHVISDKDIRDKSGSDAYQYLLFQRYLIGFSFVLALLCLTIVMPLNIYGNSTSIKSSFVATTLLDLHSNSLLIWFHSIISFLLFLAIVCVIWHYSTKVKLTTIEEVSTTLMIDGIPSEFSYKNMVVDHFNSAFPECKVLDVQFAHNVKKLMTINLQKEIATHARNEAMTQSSSTGVRPTMVPKRCGTLCCCCAQRVDVIDYYENEILINEAKFQHEMLNAYEEKIGLAFITFSSLEDARIVFENYRTTCWFPNYPMTSNFSNDLRSSKWHVSYAPPSNIINWENLCHSSRKWYLKAILINSLLFILIFTLTTPTYVMNILQLDNNLKGKMNSVLRRFLPSFIMWAVSVLLPFLVYYSEVCIGHWTKTAEHKAVIIKTYTFLLIMLLILPSLGIASLPSFLKWLLPPVQVHNKHNPLNATSPNYFDRFFIQWLCIYAPGNCAFFVNYILTSAFIGTIVELIRIPELIIYLYHQMVVKSSVEMWGIRKNVLLEFQFGLCYSWVLCVFAVNVTYCVICPLITFFGFIYLVLKYMVDRYNIYFAYGRSYIDARIHRLAMSFTVFPFLLLQINILVYLKINGTKDNVIYIFVFIGFLLSSILFIVLTYNGWFTKSKIPEENDFKPDNQIIPTALLVSSFLSTISTPDNDKK